MDLTATHLCCRIGSHTVFRGVNFALASGGALCVRGANGSGKTTLLRAIAGLIPLTRGRVLWQGSPLPTDDPTAWRGMIRYIGHASALKAERTVNETLRYACVVQGASWDDRVADAALSALGLRRHKDRKVHTLSAGQKRRLLLTRLLLAPSPIWLLDEPTAALDQDGAAQLHTLINEHRASGGIVIAATHHELTFPHAETLDLTRDSSHAEAA